MQKFAFSATLVAMLLASPAFGQIIGLGRPSPLVGHIVLDVGRLTKLSCPISGTYECRAWPYWFFRMNDYCFNAVGVIDTYNLEGILAESKQGVSLFIPDAYSLSRKLDFRQYPVEMYQCP